ncbi:FkbM family methyltransferase [Methylobacterium tardum]
MEDALRSAETRSLDSYWHEAWKAGKSTDVPYLIKIDVDGHETEILRGAKNALIFTSCQIVETTLPHLPERCALAEKAGMHL